MYYLENHINHVLVVAALVLANWRCHFFTSHIQLKGDGFQKAFLALWINYNKVVLGMYVHALYQGTP